MTIEEILKLSAGRELDELVARKVMGWKDDGTVEPWYPPGDRVGAFDRPPQFSSDWQAAGTIMDRLPSVYLNKDRTYGWTCRLFRYPMPILASGETAQLAICRAALQAVL